MEVPKGLSSGPEAEDSILRRDLLVERALETLQYFPDEDEIIILEDGLLVFDDRNTALKKEMPTLGEISKTTILCG